MVMEFLIKLSATTQVINNCIKKRNIKAAFFHQLVAFLNDEVNFTVYIIPRARISDLPYWYIP